MFVSRSRAIAAMSAILLSLFTSHATADDARPGVNPADVVATTPASDEALLRLFELMKTDENARIFGENAVEWGIDPDAHILRIGVLDLAAVPETATSELGPSVVFFQTVRAVRQLSRLSDIAPWSGGDRLNVGTTPYCSGNFNVVKAGVEYLFTAGHCGSNTFSNNGSVIGTTTQRELYENGWDDQIVGFQATVGGAPLAWTGPVSSNTYAAVKASASAAIGSELCFAGSFTGENCTAVVAARDICYRFVDGMTTCHLSKATGSGLSQLGDSGGTIYRYVTGGVAAAGMIIGGDGASTTYYHEIPALLGHWGATLQTS